MNNLQDLNVWKLSIELAKDVYLETKKFPSEEKFGIVSQIQRAAVSISANIAEGAGRNSNKEFVHFLSISNGSAYELETLLILSFEIGYLNVEAKEKLLDMNNHIIKMNSKLQSSIKLKGKF